VLESLNHNAPIPRFYKSSDCVVYTSVIHRILGYTLNDNMWVELSDQTRFRQPPSAAGAGQLHHRVLNVMNLRSPTTSSKKQVTFT
jgi:hypothetical protein